MTATPVAVLVVTVLVVVVIMVVVIMVVAMIVRVDGGMRVLGTPRIPPAGRGGGREA